MPSMIPAGPYRVLTAPDGIETPYYIIPFDKDGTCEGPKTQAHLLSVLSGYTDVFLFSHGWNNDWKAASGRYADFIAGFQRLRHERELVLPLGYKPILVGVFWPSQAMAWFDSETGPGFAGENPDAQDEAAEAARATLAEIAAMLAPENRKRFYVLAQAESLANGEAREFAALLAGLTSPDDEGPREGAPSADDLLMAARALEQPEPDLDAVGITTPAGGGGPQAAGSIGGLLGALDPRNLVKPFTVWQMKDRAGRVGARGVADLIAGILRESTARVHLLGHSYGCKVVMTALCALPPGMRKVHSALLLQPAISQYAFAGKVPRRSGPGGFVRALERTERPVIATFSRRDQALSRFFHIALRRHDDLGELQFASDGSPSIYGALGGFGPIDSGAQILEIQDPGGAYALGNGGRVVGVHGTRTISGHGDISNPSTWWLSYAVALAPVS